MSHLIGVAIEIPAPWAHELSSWRAKVGDPLADVIPPHITVLPPTPMPADAIDSAEAHLAAVASAHPTFELHLSGTGTFRPVSDVVFVTVANGLAQCHQLHDAVRAGPLAQAAAFPYHPHVTVAHGVPAESLDRAADGLADFAARFEVSEFALYTHGSDRLWRRRRSFALASPPAARPDVTNA